MISNGLTIWRRSIRGLWRSIEEGRIRRRLSGARVRRQRQNWGIAAEVVEVRSLLSAPALDWAASLGTTNGSSTATQVATDNSGNVYIAGAVTAGTVDVDFGAGVANVSAAPARTGFVAKYDTQGNFQWVATFAGSAPVSARALNVDSAGGVEVAGFFTGGGTVTFGAGEAHEATLTSTTTNGFVVKLEQATGHVVWVDGVLGTGIADNVVSDSVGNIVFTGPNAGAGPITIVNGESGATLLSFSANTDNIVVKLDANGMPLWAEGFANGAAIPGGNQGLAVDGAGNVYLAAKVSGTNVDVNPGAGTFYVSNVTGVVGLYNTCLVKLNANGQFVWGLQDTVTNNTSYPTGIAADTTGNVYLAAAGTMQFDVPGGKGKKHATASGQLARFDTNGNLQWIKATNFNGTAVTIDSVGNAIVASAYYGATKFSTSGSILWSTTTVFPYADIAVDPFGNIYFAGVFNTARNFSPVPGGYILNPGAAPGENAPYLVKWRQP